jgi:DNA-3-methyladenine glycosylase II
MAGPDGPLWAFPEPSDVLGAGEHELMEAVRNEKKARYLMSAAEAFEAGDEKFLRSAGYDEVREWLLAIDGIGPWGASLVMIRGLGRMERLPQNEKALGEAIRKLYGREMGEEEIARTAEKYGPMKAYWSYYLRVAAEGVVRP